jgi:hypothetical protein
VPEEEEGFNPSAAMFFEITAADCVGLLKETGGCFEDRESSLLVRDERLSSLIPRFGRWADWISDGILFMDDDDAELLLLVVVVVVRLFRMVPLTSSSTWSFFKRESTIMLNVVVS